MKPVVKLLINRHNNKYSYTGASDDNLLKNIELFDKLSLRFSNRVLFIKDVIGSNEICCWSFYGHGKRIAEVCLKQGIVGSYLAGLVEGILYWPWGIWQVFCNLGFAILKRFPFSFQQNATISRNFLNLFLKNQKVCEIFREIVVYFISANGKRKSIFVSNLRQITWPIQNKSSKRTCQFKIHLANPVQVTKWGLFYSS